MNLNWCFIRSIIVRVLSQIKNRVYRKELGVVLLYRLKDISFNSDTKNIQNISFKKSTNINEILSFFGRMNKVSVNRESVEKWLSQGSDCWLFYHREKVIGGSWMLRGEFTITQLTEHWLSRNLTVKFEADTLYRCYTIIDKDYRGQGIFCNFTQFLLDYYKKDPYINYVVFITRASNAPIISIAMRHNAKLIGIIEVKSVLGKIMRKELFLDHKYRKWS